MHAVPGTSNSVSSQHMHTNGETFPPSQSVSMKSVHGQPVSVSKPEGTIPESPVIPKQPDISEVDSFSSKESTASRWVGHLSDT